MLTNIPDIFTSIFDVFDVFEYCAISDEIQNKKMIFDASEYIPFGKST